MKFQRKQFDYVFLIVLFLILGILLWFAFFSQEEGFKCVADPIPYGLQKVKDATGTDFYGTLYGYGNGLGRYELTINSTDIKVIGYPY